MPWFRIDDSLPDHPDVIDLLEKRGGFSALGLWTLAGAWSARQLTDGFISGSVLKRLGGTKKQASALVDAGLWEAAEGGHKFKNWLKYQPSSADVNAKREAARTRMKRARSRERSPEQHGHVREPRPVPSRPVPTPTEGSGALFREMVSAFREITGRDDFKHEPWTGTEVQCLREMRATCEDMGTFRARLSARVAKDGDFACGQRLTWWVDAVKAPVGVPAGSAAPKPAYHQLADLSDHDDPGNSIPAPPEARNRFRKRGQA